VNRRVRIAIFLPALALLGVLLTWSLVAIPRFGDYRGPYGYVLNRVVTEERHMTNVVTATVFDYRGFDTLGEEFILFVAVMGVVLLLRSEERGDAQPNDDVGSDAVRVGGTLAVGVALLVSLWLVAFGFVTPGGGFQGGVAFAAGLLLVFLVSSYKAWSGIADEQFLDPFEGVGAGGYVVIGFAALAGGLAFLTNVLGPGTSGTIYSGGSAAFINWAVAMEVAAANLVLFSEFLEEYIAPL
jgi:multicomponent Na+:H+ antiporter subunit B